MIPAFAAHSVRSVRACHVGRARFSAVPAYIETARKMSKTPYDAAKEGKISAPNYVGWDQEIETDFQKLQVGKVDRSEYRYKKICDSALDLIGHTPMVRMSRLAKHFGFECEMLAKCEFFNAGGSVKDRIAKRMVEEAEKSGRIKPGPDGSILVEPTSGNTGIGLCLTAALKGYRIIIALPMKMSGEKVNTMKALGAEIIRTPTEAAWDAEDSHIFLSARLSKELDDCHVLDQYKNPGNPLAHYEGTAEEIIEQTGGKLDYIVMSAGTGGTVTGTAKKLKEAIPNVKVVAVDPVGSILAVPDALNDHKRLEAYQVEGIGYDFIPTVLDRDAKVIDYWMKTEDQQAFDCARAVIRHEGLMVGGSCGSTMAGAYNFIKEHNIGKDKRVVILFADGTRNYMSKFLEDDWMNAHGFKV